MSKDQAIGGAIFIVCLLVAIGYIITLFMPDLFVDIVGYIGLTVAVSDVKFWIIALPVFIAFVAIMFIGAWIGNVHRRMDRMDNGYYTTAETYRRNHGGSRRSRRRENLAENAKTPLI